MRTARTATSRFPAGDHVLVVGARPGSLGWFTAASLEDLGATVTTAGISGEEDFPLDVTDNITVSIFDFSIYHHVVCTVGVNSPTESVPDDLDVDAYAQHYAVNCLGPLRVLREFEKVAVNGSHFTAICSNSAHIARTRSGPYCASKAALALALRCRAREWGSAGSSVRPIIYGWEFGLLAGTPMTEEAKNRFDGPLSRMPGYEEGIPVFDAARYVADTLAYGWFELNGCLLRVDAGEQ